MKLNIFILISFIFLVGCSSTESIKTDTKQLDTVYISSGVEQFFLPDLPYWANFSTSGQCHRKNLIKFLNFENLKKGYGLKYKDMVHMQHMLNRKLSAYKTSSGTVQITLKDEAFVFHNVYQQVIGGSSDFKVPKFNKVSLIWVDPFLKEPKKLKKILNRDDVMEGHPVLISHCLTSLELEELSQEHKLDKLGVKYIPAEMLNIYNKDIKKEPQFKLDLSQVLSGKEMTWFGPILSEQIIGITKFTKID